MGRRISVNHAVEVLLDRGPDEYSRWKVGSGFLLEGKRVLTAAHNVGGGQVSVRTTRGAEYTAKVIPTGNVNLELDLAIVEITDPEFRDVVEGNLQFAVLDLERPDLLKGCWAIGFPRFKEKEMAQPNHPKLRDSIQVNGDIPFGSNLKSERLELHVSAVPTALPSGNSEWEGISGAVVFARDSQAGDCAIGVIVEHYRSEGGSSLTVIPLTAIFRLDELTAYEWWSLLGVSDPNRLLHLPVRSESDRAREEYLKAVEKRYGFVELVIKQAEYVSMDTIFQSLELEEYTQKSLITTAEYLNNDELSTNKGNCTIILGNPGSGKSTLLKYLAMEQARRALHDSTVRVPIFLKLQPSASSTQTLIDNLLSVVKGFSKLENAIIYLDGFDEVPSPHNNLINQINQELLRESSDKNITVFISSRSASFRNEKLDERLTGKLSIWELKPLTPSLRQNLASRLLPEIQRLLPESTKCEPMTFIGTLEHNRIAEWGENPLLFSLAAVEFVKTGTLPTNKGELYKRSIDGMLERYTNPNTLRDSLGALALELFLQRKGRMFTYVDIELIMERIREKWHKEWDNESSTMRIIKSGLLNMVAPNTYNFLHQTFQEYLAAEFLATKSIEKALGEVNRLVEEADDPSCRQVIIELTHLIDKKKFANVEMVLEEDVLYQRLITSWRELKEEYRRQDQKINPAATGISYIFEDLLSLWGDKLCTFLREGNPSIDGPVASSIAEVFERSSIERSFAVPDLITGMYKYDNKFRFIGALGKIGTEEAIEALLGFLRQTIELSDDLEVLTRLIKALGKIHTEKVGFLLHNLPVKDQHNAERKRKALQELQKLNQEKSYNLEEMREILTVTDKNGNPSDWQSIKDVADWLRHSGLRNAIVQEHLPEVTKMLEVILVNHKTHYGRNAASSALGEIAENQTFTLMLRILENKEEKYEPTVRVILSSISRFADRDVIDSYFEQILVQTFKNIQKSYPTLGEVTSVADYIQQYFKRRKLHE
jgi:energy-coupling factor transporter ATP-binding protein EcfA2/flagellar biosynthesis/type III secretory pathway chaperone